MRPNALLSTRTIFVIVSLVTLVLLIGSTIVDRLVFRADQVSASVVTLPTSIGLALGEQTTLAVQIESAATASVATAEFTWQFDEKILEIVRVVPTSGWQTKKTSTSDGVLRWVLIPTGEQGQLTTVTGPTVVGSVTIKAKAVGTAQFKPLAAETRLAAVDPDAPTSIYNAVSSVQDTSLVISPSGTPRPASAVDAVTDTVTQPAQSTSAVQQIRSAEAFIYPTSALVFVALRYPAIISIEFGLTPALGNTIELLEPTTNHVGRLEGLKESTRYYYRVVTRSAEGNSQVVSSLYSLATQPASQLAPDPAHSELKLFPSAARVAASAYIILRDQDNNPVLGQPPTVEIASGQASITATSTALGRYAYTITSDSSREQTVRVRASSNGRLIAEQSVRFDPAYSVPAPEPARSTAVELSRGVIILLASGLLLVGLLAGFLIRLARWH
jgi:hypothetical protein